MLAIMFKPPLRIQNAPTLAGMIAFAAKSVLFVVASLL